MRAILLLAALSGCNLFGSATGVVGTANQQPLTDATPPDATAAGTDATSRTGAELQAAYIRSICKLYTEPTCVTSQLSSCGAHIAFESTPACEDFFQKTASACIGLPQSLATHAGAVDRCIAQVNGFQCDTTAVCDTAGLRVDARGGCAEVQALIAACDPNDDTGN